MLVLFRIGPASPTTRWGAATIWVETAPSGRPQLAKISQRLFFRSPPAFPGNSAQTFVDHGRVVLRYGLGRSETTWPRRSRSPGASLPFVPGESRGGMLCRRNRLRRYWFQTSYSRHSGVILPPVTEGIERRCAGDRWRASRGTFRFVDPSPDPLEPRRQRHPRDRHHGHDASHLRGFGICPKYFRGAVRPHGTFCWSSAGRQFHGARQAATGEPSLSAGVDSACLSASGRSISPQGSARHDPGRYRRALRLLGAAPRPTRDRVPTGSPVPRCHL